MNRISTIAWRVLVSVALLWLCYGALSDLWVACEPMTALATPTESGVRQHTVQRCRVLNFMTAKALIEGEQ